jgi:hypothetical protein
MVSKLVHGAEDTDETDAMLIGSFYKFKKSVLPSKCVSTYDNHVDLQTAATYTKSSKNSTLHCKRKHSSRVHSKVHEKAQTPHSAMEKSIRNKMKQMKTLQREPTN